MTDGNILADPESGFSLVELLLIVAIIGLIMAIALPFWNTYKQKTIDSATITDAKNFIIAIEAILDDTAASFMCMSTAECTGLVANVELSKSTTAVCAEVVSGELIAMCACSAIGLNRAFCYDSNLNSEPLSGNSNCPCTEA